MKVKEIIEKLKEEGKTYELKNEIVLISHTDLDGYGCNIVLKSVDTGDNIRTIYNVDYQHVTDVIVNVFTKIVTEQKCPKYVFITDVSLPSKDVNKMIDTYVNVCENSNLFLIDHHDTSYEKLKDYKWAHIIPNTWRSATELLYVSISSIVEKDNSDLKPKRYFYLLENVITTISRYDTWAWRDDYKDGSEVLLNAIFLDYADKNEFVDEIISLTDHWYDYGKLGVTPISYIYQQHQNTINNYKNALDCACSRALKRTVLCRLGEYRCALLISEDYISMVSDYIERTADDIFGGVDIVITLIPNSCQCSLRTNKDDINLGRVAKYLSFDGNGGGHLKAAGCKLSTHTMLSLIETYYIEKSMNTVVNESEKTIDIEAEKTYVDIDDSLLVDITPMIAK